MVKVSIIMPVYNSEKYLSHAVESVLTQDFDDFELILVDDGSPDNSGQICDDFAKKDKRVKVIHKQNGGICSARNAGLDLAQGEYIGFCDNDDEYLPHLIKDNYLLAKEFNVDLMRYSKTKRLIKEDGTFWDVYVPVKDMFIERKDFAKNYQNIRREGTVWTGLYRKEIIDKFHIKFDETFRYGFEDGLFNLEFLNHCNKLGFNSHSYYLWSQRLIHSTSMTFHVESMNDSYKCLNYEYELMNRTCNGEVENVTKNIFLINMYVFSCVEYLQLPTCTLTMKEKEDILEQYRRNHPIFDEHIPKSTLNQVKRKNKRLWITMKLFDERKYRTLLFIVGNGSKILSKFRYK